MNNCATTYNLERRQKRLGFWFGYLPTVAGVDANQVKENLQTYALLIARQAKALSTNNELDICDNEQRLSDLDRYFDNCLENFRLNTSRGD